MECTTVGQSGPGEHDRGDFLPPGSVKHKTDIVRAQCRAHIVRVA